MLINEIKIGKKIKQKIKIRMLCCVLFMLLGAASLYVGTCVPLASGNSDYSSGYYVGLGFGLIAASVITVIKNIRLLKNQDALKQYEIYESDERNRLIGLKCWSYAGYAMFILLYIALLFAGAVNVVVMNTLLVILAVFALCLLISKCILKRIM